MTKKTSENLAAICESEGAHYHISGNTPVVLQGENRFWCVLTGHVEVFAVRMKEARVVGAKTHFFSAGPGDLLFGMDLGFASMGQGFQAVGHPGTCIAEMDLDRLKALAVDPRYRDEVAQKVDAWVAGLSRGITRDIVPRPRPGILLEPGKTCVNEDLAAFPHYQPLWIRVRERTGLFISTEEMEAGALVPLCDRSWVLAPKGAELEALTTPDALAQGLAWDALACFYTLVFQALFLNTSLNAVDVFNLIRDKTEQDQRAGQHGLRRLASVLETGGTFPVGDGAYDDHLLSACAMVGKVLGIGINPPVTGKKGEGPSARTVEEIARASGVNIRRIALPSGWWEKDLGPFVGFREPGGNAVAVLPVSGIACDIADPATGERRRATRDTADGMAGHGYTFYRYLPDHAITGRDLVKFGLRDCLGDLKPVVVLAVVIGLLSLVTPIATGYVFSEVIPGSEQGRAWGIMAMLAGFGLTTALFEVCRNISLLRVETRLHHAVESALWDRLIRLPMPFFRQFQAGDLASRAMGLGVVRKVVSGPVVTTLIGSAFSLFNLFLLFYYSPVLALAAMGLLVLAAGVILGTGYVQLKYYRIQARVDGRISGRVLQFLTAVAKIRATGAENQAFSIWAKDFSRQKKVAFKAGVADNFLMTFNGVFLLLSLMVLFPVLMAPAAGPGMDAGRFLAFNAAYAGIQAAMFQVVLSFNGFIAAMPALERLKPILAQPPETDLGKTDPGRLTGKIEVHHINFRYTEDSPLALREVSLHAEPGEFIAIVGPSGSGKSTLIRMLLGFDRPESGTIYYDDQDLAELDVAGLRRNMGVVIQGSGVLAGSLFENIAGSRPLSLDDAWEAAAMAGLDREIKQMPMGMQTMVMAGGGTLSGGQRQRLMIARAIVTRPNIILFDEATSALDNHTQAIVSRSLESLEATRIVVAHRLSTIRDADRIYVMDKGEIVESGAYDDLMEQDGLFRKIAKRQII